MPTIMTTSTTITPSKLPPQPVLSYSPVLTRSTVVLNFRCDTPTVGGPLALPPLHCSSRTFHLPCRVNVCTFGTMVRYTSIPSTWFLCYLSLRRRSPSLMEITRHSTSQDTSTTYHKTKALLHTFLTMCTWSGVVSHTICIISHVSDTH